MRVAKNLLTVIGLVGGALPAYAQSRVSEEMRHGSPTSYVYIALVDSLPDKAAISSIERHTGGQQRNIVMIRRGYQTPMRVASALLSLMTLRAIQGTQAREEMRSFQTSARPSSEISPEMHLVAETYIRRLRVAPRIMIDGAGEVPAIKVFLAEPNHAVRR